MGKATLSQRDVDKLTREGKVMVTDTIHFDNHSSLKAALDKAELEPRGLRATFVHVSIPQPKRYSSAVPIVKFKRGPYVKVVITQDDCRKGQP